MAFNITSNSDIIDTFTALTPKLMDINFFYNKDTSYTYADLVLIVAYVAQVKNRSNIAMHPQHVKEMFPTLALFRPHIGEPIHTWLHAVMKIMDLLDLVGFAEKDLYGCLWLHNHSCSITINKDSLLEAKYTRKEASKIDPTNIALMMFQLPDEAIDTLIKDYVVRATSELDSAYNNHTNSTNVNRFSNHWGNTPNNQIEGVNLDGNITTAWMYGLWDDTKKAYNYTSSYGFVAERTQEQKIAILKRLEKDIFYDNPMAVASLKAMEKMLKRKEI